MALSKVNGAHFKFIETAVDISKVPFGAGQYIVTDDGKAYYDPSTGSAVSDRIELSPDLTGFVTKVAGAGLVKDLALSQEETKLSVTITYLDSTTGAESTLSKDFAKSTAVSADDTKIVTSKAVYEAIQAAIASATTSSQAKLFELEVTTNDTAALATVSDMKQGDIAVCKKVINGDHKQYTAYMYDSDAWHALDGNYSAENVYFPQDLLTTTAIGNITLTNGQATVGVAGQNLVDAWQTIFVKEDNTGLKTGDPSARISGTSVKYIEVGSSSSQTATLSLSEDGSYKYGYTTETGVAGTTAGTTVNNGTTGVAVDTSVESPYELTYTVGSGTATALSPTATKGASFTVNSGVQTNKASAKITATVHHTAGNTPVSNLKKMYPAQKISAGTKTASTEVFRWYIPMYYGFKYDADVVADPANVTAATIKGLGVVKDANAYNQTKPTSAAATASWRQFFIAVPKSYNATLKAAKDSNNLTLTVSTAANVTITLGTTSVEYSVFYINNAAAYDTKNISLTW